METQTTPATQAPEATHPDPMTARLLELEYLEAILDLEEAQHYLGIKESLARRIFKAAGFPALRVGSLWKVRRRDLLAWARAQGEAGQAAGKGGRQ